MRRNSRSLIIYLIFGILIAVFILTFGPQSGQQTRGGCMGSPTLHVAKVGGREITDVSWRFALLTSYGTASGARLKQMRGREKVMDGLIERELLAQAAEKQGFKISNDEVERRIGKGEFYILGQQQPGQFYFFSKDEGVDEAYFDIKKLEGFVKAQGLASVDQFLEEQRRELLAQKMRELLITSVRVSPDEVKQKFVEDNGKVVVDFVKWEPLRLRDSIDITPAEIDAYAAAHEADLKKKYEADANRYKGRGKEVRLKHIFLARTPKKDEAPEPLPDAPQPTPPAPAPKPVDELPDPKLARTQAALAKIKGGADFAAIAREYSEDERSKTRGGDTGWRPASMLGFGPELAAAVEKLEIGKGPESVIETPNGFHIVRVEGRREGDLSFDQVKRDLAEDAAREEKARNQAKAAAEKALADAKAGTPLDKQFPPSDDPDASTPPSPADAAKPRLVSQAEIKRNGTILGGGTGKYIGRSAELTKALFTELKPDSLGAKVYEVDNALVIVKLVSRAEPDLTKLAEERQDIESSLRGEKAYRVLRSYTDQRCRDAKADISVLREYVEYGEIDEKTGKPKEQPLTWAPCAGDAPLILGGDSPFELEP